MSREELSLIVEIQAAGKPLEEREITCSPEGRRIESIVKEVGLPLSMILAVRGGRPVPLTDTVQPGERIRLISVVSGG